MPTVRDYIKIRCHSEQDRWVGTQCQCVHVFHWVGMHAMGTMVLLHEDPVVELMMQAFKSNTSVTIDLDVTEPASSVVDSPSPRSGSR